MSVFQQIADRRGWTEERARSFVASKLLQNFEQVEGDLRGVDLQGHDLATRRWIVDSIPSLRVAATEDGNHSRST